jgi:hypothetical protein
MPDSSRATAALSGYSEAGGGDNLEVRAVDDGGAGCPLFPHYELEAPIENTTNFQQNCVVICYAQFSPIAECVPLLRHKSKAKVGSEVHSWARSSSGSILESEELFRDAEGSQ